MTDESDAGGPVQAALEAAAQRYANAELAVEREQSVALLRAIRAEQQVAQDLREANDGLRAQLAAVKVRLERAEATLEHLGAEAERLRADAAHWQEEASQPPPIPTLPQSVRQQAGRVVRRIRRVKQHLDQIGRSR